ncbi:heat shock 22 kDa protein, mitochondrial [Tanacetum coccineum]|uniref:Heat shock 22 kDa protein, mitochondrial n=1 Tax=Tanacetum coccineum TaxID=301880 RepID=A0ABQ4Z2N0_9ASTR
MLIWPTRLKENAKQLCLYIEMPEVLEEEDVKVSVEHKSIVIKGQVDEKLEATKGFKYYVFWFDSKFIDLYKFSDIKAEMTRDSGWLKLTIPKLKQEEICIQLDGVGKSVYNILSKMSSLKKLVGSNIINGSFTHYVSRYFNSHARSNLFTRSAIRFGPTLGSRLCNTGCHGYYAHLYLHANVHAYFMYPLYLLDKDRDRESERTSQLASSWGMRLQPTRLKENSEQLCLYVQMPGVGKEEDVKVYVEHASIVIKGQIDQELIDNTSCKMYMCWLDLEFFDIYKFSDIKAEMRRNSGELKLTIPRTKEEEVSVFNVKVNIKD